MSLECVASAAEGGRSRDCAAVIDGGGGVRWWEGMGVWRGMGDWKGGGGGEGEGCGRKGVGGR